MRLILVAVGRMKSGPEAVMVANYLDRFAALGRQVGLPPVEMVEIDDRRHGGMASEGALLMRAIPPGAAVTALDERGSLIDSRQFAKRIGDSRDMARDLCFVIGGADGLAAELRDHAEWTLSLGPMVWPHLLARIMLAEQLYRAATILSGRPYHRD